MSSLVTALVLPFLLVYFLALIRLVERQLSRTQAEARGWVFNVRDALIVTLALDLTQVSQLLDRARTVPITAANVLLLTSLLLIHIAVFVWVAAPHGLRGRLALEGSTAWSYLLYIYLTLALLMTNGVTVHRVVELIGGRP